MTSNRKITIHNHSFPRWITLRNGIRKYREKLLRGKLKAKRDIMVILANSASDLANVYKSNSIKAQVALKHSCLFTGYGVIPRNGRYCSRYKTAWRRKRAIELL